MTHEIVLFEVVEEKQRRFDDVSKSYYELDTERKKELVKIRVEGYKPNLLQEVIELAQKK